MTSEISRSPICIKNEESCVIWDMPLGKIGKDGCLTVQKRQKGNTCNFYALKRILTTEQIRSPHGAQCSLLRKKITERTYNGMSLEAFGRAVGEANEIFLRSKGLDPKKAKSEYVREVIRTHIGEAPLEFLDSEMLEGMADELEKDQTPMPGFKKLDELAYVQVEVHRTIARDYGLKEVLYKDVMTVVKLIATLRDRGPIVISGKFGLSFYLGHKPIQFAEKLGEYDLYGWKKGTPTASENGFTHTIVLIGAQVKEGKSFVYWVDPDESNDPSIPGGQKRYVSSFQSTISRIDSVVGQPLAYMSPSIKPLIAVALYNPLLIT